MMGPTDEQLEQYFWGEELPRQLLEQCEQRVSMDADLLREYHQVSRLLVRFKKLREALKQSDEQTRHSWYLRSLQQEPIPHRIRDEVDELVRGLIRGVRVTRMLRSEIDRRLGYQYDVHEQVTPYQSEDISEFRSSKAASEAPPMFEVDEKAASMDVKGLFDRRPFSGRERVQRDYPEIVEFIQHHFPREWGRWAKGVMGPVPVLRKLESRSKNAPLMAALELISVTEKLRERRK